MSGKEREPLHEADLYKGKWPAPDFMEAFYIPLSVLQFSVQNDNQFSYLGLRWLEEKYFSFSEGTRGVLMEVAKKASVNNDYDPNIREALGTILSVWDKK